MRGRQLAVCGREPSQACAPLELQVHVLVRRRVPAVEMNSDGPLGWGADDRASRRYSSSAATVEAWSGKARDLPNFPCLTTSTPASRSRSSLSRPRSPLRPASGHSKQADQCPIGRDREWRGEVLGGRDQRRDICVGVEVWRQPMLAAGQRRRHLGRRVHGPADSWRTRGSVISRVDHHPGLTSLGIVAHAHRRIGGHRRGPRALEVVDELLEELLVALELVAERSTHPQVVGQRRAAARSSRTSRPGPGQAAKTLTIDRHERSRPVARQRSQPPAIDLRIDGRAHRAAMPKQLADLRQRCPRAQRFGRDRVAQPVATDPPSPARRRRRRRSCPPPSAPAPAGARGHSRAPLFRTSRPPVAQIRGHRLTSLVRQRQPVTPPALAPDGDLSRPPINVIQVKRGNLTDPQPEPAKEHQHREVPTPSHGRAVTGSQHPL